MVYAAATLELVPRKWNHSVGVQRGSSTCSPSRELASAASHAAARRGKYAEICWNAFGDKAFRAKENVI
jgi:hypothetical protein